MQVHLVDKGHISQPMQMLFVKTGWLPLLHRLRWQNVQTGGSEKFLTKVVCHVLRSSDPTVALAGWWHNQWKCEKMLQISDHLDPPSDVTEDHFCYRYFCYMHLLYRYLTTWTHPLMSLKIIFLQISVLETFLLQISLFQISLLQISLLQIFCYRYLTIWTHPLMSLRIMFAQTVKVVLKVHKERRKVCESIFRVCGSDTNILKVWESDTADILPADWTSSSWHVGK